MTDVSNQPVNQIPSFVAGTEPKSLPLVCSAFLFRLGLALLTFEQVRPAFDVQLSDYCFFVCLLLVVFRPGVFAFGREQIKILIPGWIILIGCLVSMVNGSSIAGALATTVRLIVLFGVFAPLAILHSKNLRKNLLYVLGGIFVNCVVTIIQGTVFSGIVEILSINPQRPDISDIGRFQGLTSHPNIIGLSAGLGVLIGLGFLSFEEYRYLRGRMIVVVISCSVAALLSGSRAVFVALLPALLVLAIAQRKKRQTAVRMLLAVALVWGVATYIAPSIFSQFNSRLNTSGVDLSSDYGRLWSAVYTVSEITQKPIVGWGMDHFNEAGLTEVPWTGEIVGVHNTFLKYWHGAGVLGAVGFVALFVVPARLALRRIKKSQSMKAIHMLTLGLGCLLDLFIVSNLGPFDYNRFLYIPVFIIGGFAAPSVVSAMRQLKPVQPDTGMFGSSLGPETA